MAKSAMAAGLDALDDVPADWIRVSIDDVPFGYPDEAIDAVMEVDDQLPAKVAAMRHTPRRSPSPRTAGPSRCRTTSRCRSGRSSTTSSSRERLGIVTIAGGKPTCWRG